MPKQIAPMYMLSRCKVPKHSEFRLTDIREKPDDFFNNTHERRLQPRNNFANFGSFANFSIPVESTIPCTTYGSRLSWAREWEALYHHRLVCLGLTTQEIPF